jgi:multidrug transporter EmrE-like cation transporter
MSSSWVFVAATVVLTVYGQVIVKWQAVRAGSFPSVGGAERVEYLARFFLTPWVISAFLAAGIAALAWIAALSRLDLSRAYPWMATSFIAVTLLSAWFFDERLGLWKVAGVALIVLGLIVGSRA